MPSFRQHFEPFAEQLAELYAIDRVAEVETPLLPVDERLMQCVWAEQLLRADQLATLTGRPVRVIKTGDWNTGQGPDFQGAELVIGERNCKGDVEVHLRSSDFRGHGHDRDFAYNNTILHVFLSQTDDGKHDLLHNGERLERLELEPALFPDLDTIRRTVNPDEFPHDEGGPPGKCQPVLAGWSFEQLKAFLSAAGRERLKVKARRLEDQLRGEAAEQVFYQALMTTMGQRGGKALYFLLAKRTPLEELADYVNDVAPADRALLLESIYLHVAGLLPDTDKRERLDDEEREHLARLEGLWPAVEGYFSDRLIPPSRRWLSGARPVNFATRRLSGIARWLAPRLAERGFLRRIADDFRRSAPASLNLKAARQLTKQWMAHFLVDDDSFWSRRYNWGGKRAKQAMTLIGESQARSIVLNALLPTLLLLARRAEDAEFEDLLFRFWALFPPLAPNRIVRRMRQRLFGADERIKDLLNTEQRHQALYHIFHEFCNNELRSCERCVFFSPHQIQSEFPIEREREGEEKV